MKIGAFSKKYDLKKSTIRLYTDMNLLIPDTSGTYPDYTERCEQDLEDILRLRDMEFALQEILEIKNYERIMISYTEEEAKLVDAYFNTKLNSLYNKIESLKQMITSVEEYRSQLFSNSKINLGSELSMLRHLECPLCHSNFIISNAQLVENTVTSGKMDCNCSSDWIVENGIMIQKSLTLADSSINEIKPNSLKAFAQIVPPEYISSLQRVGKSMGEYLKTLDHSQGILFLSADAEILMMQLEDTFKKEGQYIFTSSHLKSLSSLKDKFEQLNVPGEKLFICTDDLLPLKKSFSYTLDYLGTLQDYILKVPPGTQFSNMSHLINEHSEIMSTFLGFTECSTTDCSIYFKDLSSSPYFLESHMLAQYKDHNLKVRSSVLLDSTDSLHNLLPVLKPGALLQFKITQWIYDEK